MGAPTGTVTFLFTDIEGSTRLWESAPEATGAALARHDELVRASVEGHGGYLFATGGDGFAAAFARAGDAVGAAVALQAGLAAEDWPERAPIRVRIGLHTGEAEERGGDYFGPAVNRAARVMAVAHGGQVVCLAATAELLVDAELVDLGEHRLRDLDRAVRVFQVGEGAFPPLRSLDVLPGNLPLVVTSLVGRKDDVGRVAAALAAGRLVTLVGVGGVGKTRLALQVAAEVVPRFPGGAWLCELAAAATPEELAEVVAVALGVVRRSQMTVEESIVDFLRARELLIVLDNCEHLLGPAAGLAEMLLEQAPSVRILATSREALGVDGEQVQHVRPLPVSTGAGEVTSDAVTLFVARASAVDEDFSLDAAMAPAVEELCQRLDGIPLAIELAAARVATMTPAEIAGHLDERFRLLAGGRRRGVERHQTLVAAVAWSYGLLDDTERLVFDRLAVFPGSFDEAAAIAVCADGDRVGRWEVIDGLASLVAKSLVNAERQAEVTRYQLLETLRHYARDQLAARGDIEEGRRLHARHYAAWAEEAGAGLVSRDEFAWRPRLLAEIDNLRTATAWAFESDALDDVRIGVHLIGSLLAYMIQEVVTFGVASWSILALPHVERLGSDERAVVLAYAANHCWYETDFERAAAHARRVLEETDSASAAVVMALTALTMSLLVIDPGEVPSCLDDGGARFAGREDDDLLVVLLHIVTAWLAYHWGDSPRASSEAAAALAAARRIGSPALLAGALAVSARCLLDDEPGKALALAEEAWSLLEAGAGADAVTGSVAQTAAAALIEKGDHRRAAELLGSTISWLIDMGDRLSMTPTVMFATIVIAQHGSAPLTVATLSGAVGGSALVGIPFLGPAHQERFNEAVAAARVQLGEHAFALAEAAGRNLAYDEIARFTQQALIEISTVA